MRLPPGNIYVDQSFFALPGLADGAGTTTNPYDAGNFALSVNFNTLNLRKSKTGKIISAEPQTPDLAVMQLFAKSVGNGPTRLNISPKEGVVSRYAAELFHAKINNGPAAKHPNPPRVFQSLTPSGASLIHTHYSSKTLLEVIEEMLLYSNNFIANQIFLTCGALQYSAPATWEKGRKAMRRFLAEEVALPTDSFNVEEGSGLSLKNKVTAEAMATLLLGYAPYSHTLPKHKGIHVKSGTLTGAYSYAGYFERGAEKFPFVIMLNQKQNHRDKILAALKKSYTSGEPADQAFR
jgi:D-alanyl-D-alanine carboxypeptidase/D-alanyl-D-alanine-endopeptidase (penicillin-binding protein 4)